jgi:hypothetical protein
MRKKSPGLVEPLPEAISAFVGSIAAGLVITVPFYFVFPIKTWSLMISFWGIHAIMVHSFFEWNTMRSMKDPELAKHRDFPDDRVFPDPVSNVLTHLIMACVVSMFIAVGPMIFFKLSAETAKLLLILCAFAIQSAVYWYELKNAGKGPL